VQINYKHKCTVWHQSEIKNIKDDGQSPVSSYLIVSSIVLCFAFLTEFVMIKNKNICIYYE